MTLQQAARHNAQQLAFLMADEKTVLKICNKLVANRLEADGLPADYLYQREFERMAALRKRFKAKTPVRTRGNGRG